MNSVALNDPQRILSAILKMMYQNIYKGDFTNDENDLIQSIRMSSNLKTLKIVVLPENGKTVLSWNSRATHNSSYDVACYANSEGFFFSTIECFKASMAEMRGLASKELHKMALLEEEIEELKKIFRVFSQDVEVYFRGKKHYLLYHPTAFEAVDFFYLKMEQLSLPYREKLNQI